MKTLLKVSFVAMLLTAVSGCVFIDGEYVDRDDWRGEQKDNREAISQLEIGMDREAVVQRLGTPNDSEAFSADAGEVRVLFYRTQRKHSDGETTRDETTPLVFEDDVLIGWGDSVYANVAR